MKYYLSFVIPAILLVSCSGNKKEEKPADEKNAPATASYQLATVEKGGVATIIK
jgi:PBP1b-binding outer membrane lipoprotein LpoB